MGLTPLVKFLKQSHHDIWDAKMGNWMLKVMPDSNGEWQWHAENWTRGFHVNHVIGTARTQQDAEDKAVRCATRGVS